LLLVSVHGGEGLEDLLAYSDDGELLPGPVLDFGNAPRTTREFRGMCFAPDGALWLLNGSKAESAILRFTGSAPPYKLTGRIATYIKREPSDTQVNSLWHPFDLVFVGGGGLCFVSCQDTNVVARLKVDPGFEHVTPVPPPKTLPSGNYLEGTFVASSRGNLPDVPPTQPVSDREGGLDVETEIVKGKEKVVHSVRGLAWTPAALYVADEPGMAIKVYDREGRFLGARPVRGEEKPVHLLAAPDPSSGAPALYLTAKAGVFWTPLSKSEPNALNFQQCIAAKVASGIAFGANACLYVAERDNCRIKQYANFAPKPGKGEPPTREWPVIYERKKQKPEFLLYVPD
jgi:hypothetical protein